MKKQLVALTCAMGLALAAAPAGAVEIKPYGIMEFTTQWDRGLDQTMAASFQDTREYYHNTGQWNHMKHFRANQRLIMGLRFVASENLQAVYDCIAGFFTWGGPSSGVTPYPQMAGGALGTRSNNIITRNAYLDWTIPHTRIKLRMGLQNFYLPGFATGTLPIKVEFGTGIVANAPLTENSSVTAIWQRAASGPRRGTHPNFLSDKHTDDTADFFALTVPVKGEGWRVAPNAAFGIVGKDSFTTRIDYSTTQTISGRNFPAPLGYFLTFQGAANNMTATSDLAFMPVMAAAAQANLDNGTTFNAGNIRPWWLGFGGEITLWDPFRFAWDVAYGASKTDHRMFDRSGWYAGIMASYKTQYGVPTLKAWYTTGDDSDIQNGSERPVAWSQAGANLGYLNASNLYNITLGYELGGLVGTWGFSLQWNNLSIWKDVFHSLRVAYMHGNNASPMAKYARLGMTRTVVGNQYAGLPGNVLNYMTTKDSLIEIDFENIFSIYKNLAGMVEFSYIITDFDGKTWGASLDGNPDHFRKAKYSDGWRAALSLRYTF